MVNIGRKEVLDGMLGANLVCFQTYSYARHFSSSCIRVCGYESAAQGIDAQGHVVTVTHCPVGIDAARVEKDTHRPGIAPKVEAMKALYQGKKVIVGRDKLDVVKGVLQKLRAFEKLLRDYPQWRNNVCFYLINTLAIDIDISHQGRVDPSDVTGFVRFTQTRTPSFRVGRTYQRRVWFLEFHPRPSLVG